MYQKKQVIAIPQIALKRFWKFKKNGITRDPNPNNPVFPESSEIFFHWFSAKTIFGTLVGYINC